MELDRNQTKSRTKTIITMHTFSLLYGGSHLNLKVNRVSVTVRDRAPLRCARAPSPAVWFEGVETAVDAFLSNIRKKEVNHPVSRFNTKYKEETRIQTTETLHLCYAASYSKLHSSDVVVVEVRTLVCMDR